MILINQLVGMFPSVVTQRKDLNHRRRKESNLNNSITSNKNPNRMTIAIKKNKRRNQKVGGDKDKDPIDYGINI